MRSGVLSLHTRARFRFLSGRGRPGLSLSPAALSPLRGPPGPRCGALRRPRVDVGRRPAVVGCPRPRLGRLRRPLGRARRPRLGARRAPARHVAAALRAPVGLLAGDEPRLGRGQAEGGAIGLSLTTAVWVAVVALGRALPGWWPLPAAAGLALLIVLLAFVAPVVLEPLFNRFEPLADERLAAELRELAAKAGVPIRDVLVADASRRTTKSNAYVSGLGATRRVVLWDTLLESAG